MVDMDSVRPCPFGFPVEISAAGARGVWAVVWTGVGAASGTPNTSSKEGVGGAATLFSGVVTGGDPTTGNVTTPLVVFGPFKPKASSNALLSAGADTAGSEGPGAKDVDPKSKASSKFDENWTAPLDGRRPIASSKSLIPVEGGAAVEGELGAVTSNSEAVGVGSRTVSIMGGGTCSPTGGSNGVASND